MSTVPQGYVCVHVRGTDRTGIYADKALLKLDVYLSAIDAFKDKPIVVCSDNMESIDIIRQHFSNVYSYESLRTPKYYGAAVHDNASRFNRYQIGEDVLIEMLIMSLAQVLIHTESNVPLTALYFNPEVKSVYLPKS